MSIVKPYYRIWRPVKDYDWGKANFHFGDDNEPKPTLDYLYDNRFANQQEKKSLIIATRLIMRDLNEISQSQVTTTPVSIRIASMNCC